MASNMYQVSSRILKISEKARYDAMTYNDHLDLEGMNEINYPRKDLDQEYEKAFTLEMNRFQRTLSLMNQLTDIYQDVCKNRKSVKHTYWVTVSPDTRLIDFPNFVTVVNRFCQRDIIQDYTMSLEQRGTSPETLGTGFHMHMILYASNYVTSRSNLQTKIHSTFKHCTAIQCIKVELLKHDENIQNTLNYMLDYKSANGHKEKTRVWDKLWREAWGGQEIYTKDEGLIVKVRSVPEKLSFD